MIISFTGHRPDKLGGYDSHPKLVTLATDFLTITKPEQIVVGMALGWDMAVACAADGLGIPFVAAIPFVGQERFWPEQARNMYHHLLSSQMCQPEILYPGDYSPAKMSLRNGWMVDNSDVTCALWDGTTGGTGNCVRYARMKKQPIINLWPVYENGAPSIGRLWSELNGTL